MIRDQAGQRISVFLETTGGIAVTGAVPAVGELRITQSGDALANGAGVWHEVGFGYYDYLPPQVETDTEGYLAILVTVPDTVPYVFVEEIRGSLTPTSVARARRVPIWLADAARSGVTGLAIVGAARQLSLDAAAFANGLGTTGESGGGLYYYEATAAELAYTTMVLKATGAGAIDYVYQFGPIGGAGGGTAPTISVVSPDPDATVGAGGFPDNAAEAQQTEIVLDIDGPDGLGFSSVVCRYPGAANEITVYAGGAFRGEFYERSWSEVVGTALRLHVIPSGGWPLSAAIDDITFDVDAVGGDGSNYSTTRSS